MTAEQRNSRRVVDAIAQHRRFWPGVRSNDVQAFVDSWGIVRVGWVDRYEHRRDACRERAKRR